MINVIEDLNIFDYEGSAIICPINCQGYFGDGLAGEFKKKYEKNRIKCKNFCDEGHIKIGTLFITRTRNKWIIFFPTKINWEDNNSKYTFIKAGLVSLNKFIEDCNISDVFIPQIGCGSGKLNWKYVCHMIKKEFSNSKCKVVIAFECNISDLEKQEFDKKMDSFNLNDFDTGYIIDTTNYYKINE